MDLLTVLQALGYPKLRRGAKGYLSRVRETRRLASAVRPGRRQLAASGSAGQTISPGTDLAARAIEVPLRALCNHGIIVGATGSGKSYAALSLMRQLLNFDPHDPSVAFGLLDAKGELWERLQALPHHADHVLSLDFAGTAPVPYALLKPRSGETPEQLVERRMEVFDDILGCDNQLSLRMSRMLRSFLLLALETDLPFPLLELLFAQPDLAMRLAQRSPHPRVKAYFASDFARERQSTLPALSYRLDFLLRHEQLRLSFGADGFVDFSDAMDRSIALLINCGGPRLPRALSQIVQSLVLSDLRQATFARTHPTRPYLWFVDEAQCLFARSADTDNLTGLLTMARSFGVSLALITQSLTAAAPQPDFLTQLETNVRWVIQFRSSPRDAQILESGLLVTGQLVRTRYDRGRLAYMTPGQELRSRLRDIANLPPRTGYFWLRGAGRPAVLMKTHPVAAARAGQTRIPSTTVAADQIRDRLADAERRLVLSETGSTTTRSSSRRKGAVDEVLMRLEREFLKADEHAKS